MTDGESADVHRRGFLRRLAGRVRGVLGRDYPLVGTGAVIGVVTGLGALGFSELIELVRRLYFHDAASVLQRHGLYLWMLPLLPMSGALLVGLITYFFAPEAEGHGVPEVMNAMVRKGGRIRPRVAGATAVASAVTIGSGGSAGTEGPIIQIGAAIGSGLGQWLQMGPRELRVLIGCGAAAGIGAIFNAPIAGVLFAVEVLLRDLSLRAFIPIIVSAVGSLAVTQAVRGHSGPIFPVPLDIFEGTAVYRFTLAELGNYAILGLVCGLVARAFVALLYLAEDLFQKLPVHRIARPVSGALLVGLLALGTEALTGSNVPLQERGRHGAAATAEDVARPAVRQPPIMGNGYPVVGESLEPRAYLPADERPYWTVRVLLILLAAKVLATCLTLGSGGSGGVFAPCLFIGAVTGGAFGLLVQSTGWFADISPGAYALVGMATVVAASMHAPLTAGLMLFELTRDYEVIIPIMLAGVIGLAVAQRLHPASIYTLKLLRRGIDIHQGQDISLLRHLLVRDEMRSDFVTVRPISGVPEIVQKLMAHPGYSIFVVDEERRLKGVITASECRTLFTDQSACGALIAEDVMREKGFPTMRATDTLADVMQRLANYRGEVPVVEDGRLIGAIWPEDVIARYNSELFKRDMAASMVSAVTRGGGPETLPALPDTIMAEIPVPLRFCGQSLGHLEFRNRYRATVLLIKRSGTTGEDVVQHVPGADFVFQPGDVMLVMAPAEEVPRLERGEP